MTYSIINTAKALIAGDKGLLAMDESVIEAIDKPDD
jgi:hypothetical protein